MPLKAHAWQKRPITLTPLIDIIFLLLLFFMLSSTFTRFAEIPLQNAGSGGAEADGQPVFLQLGPEDLRLNGETHGLDDLLPALAGFETQGAVTTLLVTLSEDVTSQRLLDLLVVLRTQTWLAVAVLG